MQFLRKITLRSFSLHNFWGACQISWRSDLPRRPPPPPPPPSILKVQNSPVQLGLSGLWRLDPGGKGIHARDVRCVIIIFCAPSIWKSWIRPWVKRSRGLANEWYYLQKFIYILLYHDKTLTILFVHGNTIPSVNMPSSGPPIIPIRPIATVRRGPILDATKAIAIATSPYDTAVKIIQRSEQRFCIMMKIHVCQDFKYSSTSVIQQQVPLNVFCRLPFIFRILRKFYKSKPCRTEMRNKNKTQISFYLFFCLPDAFRRKFCIFLFFIFCHFILSWPYIFQDPPPPKKNKVLQMHHTTFKVKQMAFLTEDLSI